MSDQLAKVCEAVQCRVTNERSPLHAAGFFLPVESDKELSIKCASEMSVQNLKRISGDSNQKPRYQTSPARDYFQVRKARS